MKLKKETPVIYLWVYHKLGKKGGSILRTSVVLEVIRRNFYQIPRSIHYKILDDMERYKLIEKINHKKGYRILDSTPFDLKPIDSWL